MTCSKWAQRYRVDGDQKVHRRYALTQEELRSLLDYDPRTGVFTTRTKRGRVSAGAVAGTIDDEGRVVITINYVRHFAHRLAWLYMVGNWPIGEIDHRDANCANNRFSNLRDVTSVVNQQNKRTAPASKKYSTLLGAHWCKQLKRWKSAIRVDGKSRHLGCFDTEQQAHEAYVAAKRVLHEGCTL